MSDYVIIYKIEEGEYRIYNNKDKSFSTGKFPKDTKVFNKLKHDKYPKSDEGLEAYAKDFKKWCTELKEATKIEGKR